MEYCTCPVCNRKQYQENITIHHWKPQCNGGTLKETFQICITCHTFLHYLIPINEVEFYSKPEDLLKNTNYVKFLSWISKKNNLANYKSKKYLKQFI